MSYQFIRNVASAKVLDVEGGNTEPGSNVIIYSRNPAGSSDNQLWEFHDGFVVNKRSGHVLEAPLNGGGLLPGTALIQQEKRDSNNLNQQWNYDNQYRLISKFDENLCIWGQDGNVQDPGTNAVVDIAIDGEASQEWMFDFA